MILFVAADHLACLLGSISQPNLLSHVSPLEFEHIDDQCSCPRQHNTEIERSKNLENGPTGYLCPRMEATMSNEDP